MDLSIPHPLLLAANAAVVALAGYAVIGLRRHLRRLTRDVRRLATGELADGIAPIAGSAELGALAAAIERLRVRIASQITARERDARELERALLLREREPAPMPEPSDPMDNLGLMAAGIAHEISNPMTCVVSSISYAREVLADPVPDAEAIDEALRDAHAGAGRVRQILDELKSFTRGSTPNDDGFAVGDVVGGVLELVASQTRGRCRVVRVDATDLMPVAGDDQHLGQALLNVVINAIQAFPASTHETNTITIATAMTERDVVIEVADNGPGIAIADLPRIFDPFFTTRPGVGTGLGLTVARRLVRAMGGTLEVISDQGRGTTVEIRLRVFDGTAPRRPLRPSQLSTRAQA